jgi:hypothetical protein
MPPASTPRRTAAGGDADVARPDGSRARRRSEMVPKRTDLDGLLSVDRLVQTMPPHEEAGFHVELTYRGKRQEMSMGGYNAARLAVALCIGLRIEPPPELAELHRDMVGKVVSVG